MTKEKLPKEIQEIMDNQGKIGEKARKEIDKFIEEIYKMDKETEAKLRELLGC